MPLMDVRDPWFDGFFRLLGAEYEACRAAGRPESLDLVDRTGDLLLRRLVALRPTTDAAGPQRVTPLRPYLLREVLRHVEAHLGERLSLEALAGIAAMSGDHFLRAFEQATGSTPHRWIVERRLDVACGRLADSSERIEQIAHACGFAGAAHFAATFRRHRGMTPSAYRRQR
jgi:AraC family transcriptional regulator